MQNYKIIRWKRKSSKDYLFALLLCSNCKNLEHLYSCLAAGSGLGSPLEKMEEGIICCDTSQVWDRIVVCNTLLVLELLIFRRIEALFIGSLELKICKLVKGKMISIIKSTNWLMEKLI